MSVAEKHVETVMLEFLPVSCSFGVQQQLTDSFLSTISMRLRLAGGDTVETPDGRSLDRIDWSIRLQEGAITNEHAMAHGAIGMLNYYPDTDYNDEGASAWAHLDADRFALLTKCVLAGHLPSVIRMQVTGLGYGRDPDGSEKVWDVREERNAPLKQVLVDIDVMRLPKERAEVLDVDNVPSVAVVEGRGDKMPIDATLERISRRLGWVVFFAACAALAAIFR